MAHEALYLGLGVIRRPCCEAQETGVSQRRAAVDDVPYPGYHGSGLVALDLRRVPDHAVLAIRVDAPLLGQVVRASQVFHNLDRIDEVGHGRIRSALDEGQQGDNQAGRLELVQVTADQLPERELSLQ